MSDEHGQPTEQPVTDPEPEPEGIVEVQGKRLVSVDALVAERERAKKTTEEKVRAEYEPLKAKAARADQLEADLQLLQPHIDHLRKHPELLQEPAKPDIPDVSNDEAEKFARRYELYTPTGLDITRAKQMIADNRAETKRIAKEAAQEAVQPYAQTTATSQSRQNFAWAASQRGQDGQPLVDPNVLAQIWATFPAELTANGEVAKVVLRAAIGESVVSGKRPQRLENEPVFSEAPGGQRQPHDYRMSPLERNVARVAGMSEKDFAAAAKQYKPDAYNVLGD